MLLYWRIVLYYINVRTKYIEFTAALANKDPKRIEQAKKFISDFNKLIGQLDKTLNLTEIFADTKSILRQQIGSLGDITSEVSDEWYCTYGQLHLLARDLLEVQAASTLCFTKLTKDLMKQRTVSQWHDFRLEARVYATILRQGLLPKARESPDFQFKHKQNLLYIEATGCSYASTASTTSPVDKIKYCHESKNSKPYASKDTILLINITNMIYTEELKNKVLNLSGLVAFCESVDSKFGAIIIQSYFYTRSNQRYSSCYNVIQKNECTVELESYLKEFYPKGNLNFFVGECTPSPVC